jgi:hypothetical protein
MAERTRQPPTQQDSESNTPPTDLLPPFIGANINRESTPPLQPRQPLQPLQSQLRQPRQHRQPGLSAVDLERGVGGFSPRRVPRDVRSSAHDPLLRDQSRSPSPNLAPVPEPVSPPPRTYQANLSPIPIPEHISPTQTDPGHADPVSIRAHVDERMQSLLTRASAALYTSRGMILLRGTDSTWV